MRWLPTLLAAAVLLVLLGSLLLGRCFPAAKRASFPPELIPPGGVVIAVTPGVDDRCYAHERATIHDAGELARWAAALDLPCTVDAGTCTRWSTDARGDPFWRRDLGDVEGLDSVTATLSGGVLTIDWGDYLCAGPN